MTWQGCSQGGRGEHLCRAGPTYPLTEEQATPLSLARTVAIFTVPAILAPEASSALSLTVRPQTLRATFLVGDLGHS